MTNRNPCGRGKHDRSDVYPKADRRLYAILARPFFNTPLERRPKERKHRKGKLVETDTAVEIDYGGLRQLFLDDFHRCLENPAGFPTVTPSTAVIH